MKFVFRILDVDTNRLKDAEATIRRMVRKYGFSADIFQVQEVLEHGRLGIAGELPALEINGVIVSKNNLLNEEILGPLFEGLYAYYTKSN